MKGIYLIILFPLIPLMILGGVFDLLYAIFEDYPREDIGRD
jgi:hypothetical protein